MTKTSTANRNTVSQHPAVQLRQRNRTLLAHAALWQAAHGRSPYRVTEPAPPDPDEPAETRYAAQLHTALRRTLRPHPSQSPSHALSSPDPARHDPPTIGF
jgi:hypothetical protein